MFGRRKGKKATADALYQGISRKSDPSKESPADMVAKAKETLGLSTKDVAERLGVSERSVQRWASGEGKPRWGNAAKLKNFVRDSPEMRRAQLSNLREARIKNQGSRIKVKGEMGVTAGGKKYRRNREIEANLSPDAMSEVMEKWLQGDDQGAMDALHEALGSEYVDGFELADALEGLEFLR
ncbi:helix-turn-helix domain-containing protein [Streptomyces sp. NPDC059278]|uniref:helix-turn-helix domain-containing protein n=1 Tax=Streptomyces sp. NPDC059278 TaxID=3346801 RepID=UPI0036845ECC